MPALRLLLPWIAGILTQHYMPWGSRFLWTGLVVFFLIWTGRQCWPDKQTFRWSMAPGVSLSALFFFAGGIRFVEQDIRNDPFWLGHQKPPLQQVMMLDESFQLREKSWKATASLLFLTTTDGRILPVSGRVLLYLRRAGTDSATAEALLPGQRLVVRTAATPIPAPANPGQFDYRNFCMLQGITHQIFAEWKDVLLLPPQPASVLRLFLDKSRRKVIRILQTFIKNPQAAGLAEALLIGYRNDLDRNLLQQYADTGVVHIIAISGLHLGLIFTILRFCTRRLPAKGRWRWLQPLLVLAGLWLFTLLAGAQPSVLRSAVMFSFMVMGDFLHRRAQVLNTLCFSAFVLLCWEPNWLWDIGFQLSYAAVASLILFMQPLYRLFFVRQKWLRYVWQMNAVTLSAQILTLPLCLYHFHQFPNYFLLANLVCVPLSGLLLGACIGLCALAPFTVVATWLGWGINAGVQGMNGFVQFLQQLPGSVSRNIAMDFPLALISSCFLFMLARALLFADRRARYPVILCALAMATLCYWQRQQQIKRLEWRLYLLPGQTVFDVVAGDRYAESDVDSVVRGSNAYQFALQHARLGCKRVSWETIPNLQLDSTGLRLGNKKIFMLRRLFKGAPHPRIDVLCLMRGSRISDLAILNRDLIGTIVADGSLSLSQSARWRQMAAAAGIPFHDVKTDGAFVVRCR